MRHAILTFAILTQFLVVAAIAAPKPAYNITGHWLGTSVSAKDQSTSNLEATFTSLNGTNTKFSGTMSVNSNSGSTIFGAHGTVNAKGAVKANLTYTGTTASIAGKVDAGTNTITGTYKSNQHGHTDHGTFTITKS